MHRRIITITALVFMLSASCEAAENMITTGTAVSGDILMFGDALGIFSAVSSNSQTQLWTYQAGDSTSVGTPAVCGDTVIFAQVTGEITCLKISDGSLVWKYAPAFKVSTNAGLNDGVAVGDGRVYAAFMNGELKALDLKTGKPLWSYSSDQGLRTAPAYSDGMVFLGEYNGLFSMLDAETGKRINGGGAGGAVNTPSVSDGNVYYSAWDGSVHAVRIKGVIPLWSAKVSEPVTTSPVIDDGRVFVGTASGKVAALNQKDGAILWEHATQGGQLRLSASGGRVSVNTEDGRNIVLDAETGKDKK